MLHAWQNDVTPPRFRFLTKVVSPGRPRSPAIVIDRGAGVDPLSLVIGYKRTLLLAALYDPGSGLVLFPLDGAPRIPLGRTPLIAVASDFQESKNVDQAGDLLPNTAFRSIRLRAVARPTVNWLLPEPHACAGRAEPLFVRAGSTRGVRTVTLLRRQAADRDGQTRRRGSLRRFVAHPQGAPRAGTSLRAVVIDRRGSDRPARRLVCACAA